MRHRRHRIRSDKRGKKFVLLLLMFSSSTQLLSEEMPRQHRIKEWSAGRDSRSAYYNILQELRLQGAENYRKYLRMNVDTFEYLLQKIRPSITLKTTVMRKPVSPEEQLAITLRYFATGESYASLMYQYRVSDTCISRIIPRVCKSIIATLMDECLVCPKAPEEWKSIADEYNKKWDFPNCIDGKHISLCRPKNSVSQYYKYKNFYSIILMAIVDANYKFIFVDVGCQGQLGDGAVFKNSSFYKNMVTISLNLPPDNTLSDLYESSNSNFALLSEEFKQCISYVIVADYAFPLKTHHETICTKRFIR